MIKEDKNREDCNINAEGGLLCIPVLRLPHSKPLSGDHREDKEPQEEGYERTADGVGLGAVEVDSRPVTRLPHSQAAQEEKESRNDLRADDKHIDHLPGDGARDRPIFESAVGKCRVHAHHMGDEDVVRMRIEDVVEGDEQTKGRERQAHGDLGEASDQQIPRSPSRRTYHPRIMRQGCGDMAQW
jgi:hypothetical protein